MLKKLFLTIFVLTCLRFINMIPLPGIDHIALKKDNIETSIFGFINFYKILNAPILNPLSLGLIPYINSSLIIDLYSTFVPKLRNLQTDDGPNGKRKILFYKKVLALVFATIQGSFLINSLIPYIYQTDLGSILEMLWILIIGSLITIWSVNFIDKNGIGNGTSLIIFSTIIINLIQNIKIDFFHLQNKDYLGLTFLVLFCYLIYELQQKIYCLDVISARQLSLLEETKNNFLEKYITQSKYFLRLKKKKSGLLLKPTQAGIFPIIIVTNIFPILFLTLNISFETNLGQIIYFCLISIFNYFYTSIFWDPQKISEELKKYAVTIKNIDPGKETNTFLKKILLIVSTYGGIYLSFIIFFYQIIKTSFDIDILNKINISSLIILIGISSEIQKSLKILSINLKYLNKN